MHVLEKFERKFYANLCEIASNIIKYEKTWRAWISRVKNAFYFKFILFYNKLINISFFPCYYKQIKHCKSFKTSEILC